MEKSQNLFDSTPSTSFRRRWNQYIIKWEEMLGLGKDAKMLKMNYKMGIKGPF